MLKKRRWKKNKIDQKWRLLGVLISCLEEPQVRFTRKNEDFPNTFRNKNKKLALQHHTGITSHDHGD